MITMRFPPCVHPCDETHAQANDCWSPPVSRETENAATNIYRSMSDHILCSLDPDHFSAIVDYRIQEAPAKQAPQGGVARRVPGRKHP